MTTILLALCLSPFIVLGAWWVYERHVWAPKGRRV